MKRRFLALATIILNVLTSNGQASYPPQIGKAFKFTLDSVENYSKKTISYNDFKGKWIILDFWSETCSGCINSFPHVDVLQKKYQDNVQFVLVTGTQKEPITAITLFKRLKKKFDLTMPVSFDQDFFNRVGPRGLPLQVVLNPKGIVEAICSSISETDLVSLLNGKRPELVRSYLKYERSPSDSFNAKVSVIADTGNNTVGYLYKSIITDRDKNRNFQVRRIERNRVEFLNSTLDNLYRYAYIGKNLWLNEDSLYGKYAWLLTLDVKDSSLFTRDFSNEKNSTFCYSLMFSHDVYTGSRFDGTTMADKSKFQKILQGDLERCFGYTAKVETRKMPYYRLVATPEARQKLKTKGNAWKYEYINANAQTGFVALNVPVQQLIGRILSASGKIKETMPPIIDETGIEGNIDITIDAIFFDDWLSELRKNGLDLVLGEKEMKAIVIYDEHRSLIKKGID